MNYYPYRTNYTYTRGMAPVTAYSTSEAPRTYSPVTAYTATEPIIVNGVDINTGLYPILNYKPQTAQYPYIYVPIAQFSRVGGKVVWDEANMVLTVTTDYFRNKQIISEQQAKINELQDQIDLLTSFPPGFQLDVTNIEGVTEAQKTEIDNLVATKTQEELTQMMGEAIDQTGAEFGVGIDGDSFGAGGLSNYDQFSFIIHSNDPNLAANYQRYTYEQKEKFIKYQPATFYVVLSGLLAQ